MEKNKMARYYKFYRRPTRFYFIRQALRIATELIDSAKGANKYSPVAGIPLLRKLIAEKAKKNRQRFFNKNLSEKNVLFQPVVPNRQSTCCWNYFLTLWTGDDNFIPVIGVSYPKWLDAAAVPIVFPYFYQRSVIRNWFSKMEEMIKTQGVKI